MAYRSAEEAARVRVEELEADLAQVTRANLELAGSIEAMEREASAATRRLAEAGPAGGEAGPARDRVATLAMMLALAEFPLLTIHAEWHGRLGTDSRLIPAVLLLGAPGALAFFIGAPHARASWGCAVAAVFGAAFAGFAVAHAIVGAAW